MKNVNTNKFQEEPKLEFRASCYDCERLGVDCAAMHPPNINCFKLKGKKKRQSAR